MAPSSMTKMMTIYVALSQLKQALVTLDMKLPVLVKKLGKQVIQKCLCLFMGWVP